MKDETAVAETKNWVERVVIGLNLCPFARPEWDGQRIRYRTVDHNNSDHLDVLREELAILAENSNVETTLIIFPHGQEDFYRYLELLDIWDRDLDAQGLRGTYQLASFHPDYQFEGTAAQDPANFTNRSPHPIIHLLRESTMERVLAKFPNPESIPQRNIERTRSLGIEAMRSLLGACRIP